MLLAGAAAAQDDRVLSAAQMAEGIAACLGSKADPTALTAALAKTGWTSAPDANGTLIFTPPNGDNTLVMRPNDATLCRVESMDLNTDKAAGILAQALTSAGVADAKQGADDNGCPRVEVATGSTATLISGDDDTSCTSKDTSAIRFDFGAAQ